MNDEPKAPLRRNGEGLGRDFSTRRSGWAIARELRRQETPAEIMLWARLWRHGLGVPFRRQHPIGPFIVDFLSPGYALILELDGKIHDRTAVREQDHWREDWLIRQGFRLIRFQNQQVVLDMEAVLAEIQAALVVRGAPIDLKTNIDQ